MMRTFVMAIAGCMWLAAVHAGSPGWWTTRGVLNTNASSNDFAAVNQGQVKHIAYQAYLEMEQNLPGGAGSNVTSLVNSFSQNANYGTVNIGQLKNIAKPFYDRLIETGHASAYPWAGSPNDYALANIGQLKNLFSWDLSSQ
jgi:hypothetical protein